jgi:hypothetical protein
MGRVPGEKEGCWGLGVGGLLDTYGRIQVSAYDLQSVCTIVNIVQVGKLFDIKEGVEWFFSMEK